MRATNEMFDKYVNDFDKCVNELERYVRENGLRSLVLGVSGGIDSALVAAIAESALTRLPDVKLIGVWMEIEGNKLEEKQRAKMVGEAFCDEYHELNLTTLFEQTWMSISSNHPSIKTERTVSIAAGNNKNYSIDTKIRMGNVKARLRMITLYDFAQANRGMVLSTDNFTEYLLGFWTLHGDVGDFGPIQELWKTEVYNMAETRAAGYSQDFISPKEDGRPDALRACIAAVPTDGLGITDSDLDQLGAATYAEVDEILKFVYNSDISKLPSFIKDHPVVRRHIASAYKRILPINIKFQE